MTYSDISDAALDRLIEQIKQQHPNDGERLMIGHLSSCGVSIPRVRLRASIHRVDPVNTALRRSITVRRRVYYAEGPNSVWHIDGHHKLIRWRLITHGGIDGFSRTIVYLRCANNNRASTVADAFMEACSMHGLPQKVRSDLGGENVEVWRYMVEQHMSHSAVITGSSTHNERIERLWRDLMRCVITLYYDTFKSLEESGKLDPLNNIDLYCLHRVYLPRINACLDAFVESWNNHPLSSERNMTPSQLFVRGAIEQNISITEPASIRHSNSVAIPQAADAVGVPRIEFEPCEDLEQQLQLINPLLGGDYFSTDVYNLFVNVLGSHLRNGCTRCSF